VHSKIGYIFIRISEVGDEPKNSQIAEWKEDRSGKRTGGKKKGHDERKLP